jgi:hypothetical protein
VRKAAEDQGLIAAGAQINVSAGLAADGYALKSAAVQTAPLNAAGATELHWAVERKSAPHQPMQVNVCLQLPSGDPQVCGGPVEGPQGAGDNASRMIGFGLIGVALATLVALVVRARTRAAEAREREKKERKARESSGLGF